MKSSPEKTQLLKALRQAAESPALLESFLEDLLTPAELEDVVKRWRIVSMLDAGIPQREIAATLGVSLSKITRGSRELLDKKGGFAKVLAKT